MNEESTIDYLFAADCHGLYSVSEFNAAVATGIGHACIANPQRFPVWGTIPLTKNVYESLVDMIKTDVGKKEALKLIKTRKYNLPSRSLGQMKKNMEKIPNDELDPFH